MRVLLRGLIAAALILVVAGTSSAGPVCRLVHGVAERVHERRSDRLERRLGRCELAKPSCCATACPAGGCTGDTCPLKATPKTPSKGSGVISGPTLGALGWASATVADGDGLDEVNAQRATRGLRPFLRDEGLTAAARACAAFRARHLLFGHTTNDFAFADGAPVSATGCAAYPASYGWMSCCTYESYTAAGAVWVMGTDGRRYMHLFVR